MMIAIIIIKNAFMTSLRMKRFRRSYSDTDRRERDAFP